VDGAGGPGAGAGVFDGVDLDWEYPGGNGLATNHSSPQDGPNYVALLAEFRRQFAAIGRPDLLLTMAGAAPVVLLKQYNLEEAQQYLDIFSLMSYDFTGPYAATTGHHTNLCTSQLDPAPVERRHSADVSVHALQEIFHIPPEKIVVGAAFYGKAWTGVKPENNGLFQPGQGMQQGGGSYRRLKTLPQEGYTRYWDPGAQAPYLYEPASGTFWTYDDPESVALKARYVKHWGLGGVMFWEITEDDEQGSLVSAITQGFRAEDIGDPCESGGK
jgi:chitinase